MDTPGMQPLSQTLFWLARESFMPITASAGETTRHRKQNFILTVQYQVHVETIATPNCERKTGKEKTNKQTNKKASKHKERKKAARSYVCN